MESVAHDGTDIEYRCLLEKVAKEEILEKQKQTDRHKDLTPIRQGL